ncbi:unnamed protein product [Moneuplotes crassus]|uniref:Uncharacterized protein n=1 Tax=Euplotes crassus TaxID=5936 RepID=A0AAD1UDW2_EUPCR|nr:unnamed protein product [Moneuplotes crassus]
MNYYSKLKNYYTSNTIARRLKGGDYTERENQRKDDKVYELKRKFQRIVDSIDQVDDENEYQRLSKLAEISNNLVMMNSPSTNCANTDSDTSSKTKEAFKPTIKQNTLDSVKCDLQNDLSSSFQSKNHPKQISNQDTIDIFGEAEINECEIHVMKNSIPEMPKLHPQQSTPTPCNWKKEMKISAVGPTRLSENTYFSPKHTAKIQKYCNQTIDFTLSDMSCTPVKTPIAKPQAKKRRDRATRSKHRSMKRKESISSKIGAPVKPIVTKKNHLGSKPIRGQKFSNKKALIPSASTKEGFKSSQQNKKTTASEISAFMRNPSGEKFRTELKKLSKSWLKEKVAAKPKSYNAHKAFGPSLKAKKKNVRQLSRLNNAHQGYKKSTEKADFLSRNKKMMDLVKARKDIHQSKSKSRSTRVTERNNEDTLNGVSPDVRNSLKMKSLLNKFRSNKI